MSSTCTDPTQNVFERLAATFDPAENLLVSTYWSPGYHTRMPTGARVHLTKDSAEFALAALVHGVHTECALAIFERLLELQDTDPLSPTYGLWSWMPEEPLDRMDPPDWNWADFIGEAIVLALRIAPERIPASMRTSMRAALRHAALCIFRRNVLANYTNICAVGGGVCVLAGEELEIPWLVDYGARRLESMVAHFDRHGDFQEYNSPCYIFLTCEVAEQVLRLARDERALSAGRALHQRFWQAFARFYHPGSGEQCGPYSRIYRDRMESKRKHWLAVRTGIPMPADERDEALPPVVEALPCPESLRQRFVGLPEPEIFFSHRFAIRTSVPDQIGTAWMNATACLGSINREFTWVQRRVLNAFWRTAPTAPSAAFTVAVLKDGKPFAAVLARTVQQGPRALLVLTPAAGVGDYHPIFDVPADGHFALERLTVRFQLDHPEARVEDVGESFVFTAGDTSAVVVPGGMAFPAGSPGAWATGVADGRAYAEATLHAGMAIRPDFREGGDPFWFCAGVEICGDQFAKKKPVQIEEGESRLNAFWAGLSLEVGTRPEVQPF